jgi:hypothetical protein
MSTEELQRWWNVRRDSLTMQHTAQFPRDKCWDCIHICIITSGGGAKRYTRWLWQTQRFTRMWSATGTWTCICTCGQSSVRGEHDQVALIVVSGTDWLRGHIRTILLPKCENPNQPSDPILFIILYIARKERRGMMLSRSSSLLQ